MMSISSQSAITDKPPSKMPPTMPAPITIPSTNFFKHLKDGAAVLSTTTETAFNDDRHSLLTPVSMASPPLPARNMPATAFAFQSILTLSLCNETLVFDIQDSDIDSRALVALLKETRPGKDQWMVAGGYYRHQGLFKDAIAVMMAMLEVHQKKGHTDPSLKPVYLFLSSCHTDLMRRARTPAGDDTPASRVHQQEATRWLHKVYGPDVPALSTLPCSPAPVRIRPPPPAPAPILQREIAALRERQERMQGEKRALEGALGAEREKRRRLEESGRRAEVLARREAEARRDAERELERVRRDAEARERERDAGGSVHPILEDLAAMISRAGLHTAQQPTY